MASPERTRIGKSIWKDAFGDPYETLERKFQSVASISGGNNISAERVDVGDDDNDDDDDSHRIMTVAPKYLSESASGDSTTLRDKLERRMSASSIQSSKYRQRLGILRTVDLSGETMEG